MCVCVSFYLFWSPTPSSVCGGAPAGVTQEEGQTVFFIIIIPYLPSAGLGLLFMARRVRSFLALDH